MANQRGSDFPAAAPTATEGPREVLVRAGGRRGRGGRALLAAAGATPAQCAAANNGRNVILYLHSAAQCPAKGPRAAGRTRRGAVISFCSSCTILALSQSGSCYNMAGRHGRSNRRCRAAPIMYCLPPRLGGILVHTTRAIGNKNKGKATFSAPIPI